MNKKLSGMGVLHSTLQIRACVDWSTGTSTCNGILHNKFPETVRDNFLWQLIDSPTCGENILELLLTNIPHKVRNVCVFEDILKSNHNLVDFYLNFNIHKKPPTTEYYRRPLP